MFSTIQSLFNGFAGKLYGESAKLVWLLLVTFLAGWAATFFAGWVSFPSYYALLEHLPGARIIAICFTAGIAGFIYFSLAYLSGYCIEHWMNSPVRNYTALGAKIIAIAALVFLAVDFYMNMQGKEYRAEEAAGTAQTFTYQTDPAHTKRLEADRSKLDELTTCKIGGLSWIDPETGRCYLNQSGKKMQKELTASIRRVEQADSTARARFIADLDTSNQDRDEREASLKATLRNAVYGVYLFVLMFCIVQAYIVESMQIRGYAEGSGSAAGQVKAQEGKIGFATGQHRGRSDALDAQIEELKKLLNDAAEEMKNGPENRAEIGYAKTGSNPGETYPVLGGQKTGSHTFQKEIHASNQNPVFTRHHQPVEYRGINEKKYQKYVKVAQAYLKANERYNKAAIARQAGISESAGKRYFKVAIARQDIPA